MKKKRKTGLLLTLTAVLACLTAALVLLQRYRSDQEAEKAASESAADADAAVLISAEEDQIASIRVKNSHGDYTFEKKEDRWIYRDAEDFPLQQSYLTSLAGAAAGLGGKREVSDSLENAADYGLEEPAYIFTVTDTDGNETTVCVGDENSKASVYYAYLEGGQKIYTISEELPEAGGYGLYDMIDAVSFPGITVSNINQVKMTLSDGRWMLLTREMKEEKSTEEGDESAAAAEQETVWVYTDSQDRRVETETASSVSWLQTVASIEYGSCTDYKVEGEALKEYGLDAPAELQISYSVSDTAVAEDSEDSGDAASETEIILLLGSLNEEGNYYLQQQGSSQLMSLDKETGDILMQMREKVTEQ